MGDNEKVRCPKCGFLSEGTENCDACGAIFARVRAREVESEFYSNGSSPHVEQEYVAPSDESYQPGSTGRLFVWLVVLFAFLGGGWYAYNHYVRPERIIIKKHEQLVTKARKTFGGQAANQSNSVMQTFREETHKLTGSILDLPKPKTKEDELRRAALIQANAMLEGAFNSSASDLRARMENEDPFELVDENLALAKASKRVLAIQLSEQETSSALATASTSAANGETSAPAPKDDWAKFDNPREKERQQMIENARAEAKAVLYAQSRRGASAGQIDFAQRSKVLDLTVDLFDQAASGSDPLFVDFWAPWCGPCKKIAPVVEELAFEYDGKIRVARVNVDNNRELATRYGVTAIPTFIVFKDGKAVDRVTGALPKDSLRQLIERAI